MPEQKIATWEAFAEEMNAPGRDWASLLPPNISPEKFRAVAITAVKQNPDLLKCTARSLFNAISRAAQDGLMPDGREGFINSYNTKIKDGGKDVWYETAQWQPMAFGLRKRARELDDIVIDAQVVYQNDKFVWFQGDDARIEHSPVPLGRDRDTGPIVGAYAIFRKNGVILHREVMDAEQIEKSRAKSKFPDSLMWKDFTEEGYRKTVLRRGIKTVPVSDSMAAIIKRDDEENFDLTETGQPADVVVPPRPRQSEFRREPARVEAKPEPEVLGDVSAKKEPEPVEVRREQEGGAASAGMQAGPEQPRNPIDPKAERERERQDWIKDAWASLEEAKAGPKPVHAINDLEDSIADAGVLDDAEEKKWRADCDAARKSIMAANKGKAKS